MNIDQYQMFESPKRLVIDCDKDDDGEFNSLDNTTDDVEKSGAGGETERPDDQGNFTLDLLNATKNQSPVSKFAAKEKGLVKDECLTGFTEDISSRSTCTNTLSSLSSTMSSDSSVAVGIERPRKFRKRKSVENFATKHKEETQKCSYKLRRKSNVDYLETKISRNYVDSVNISKGKYSGGLSVKKENSENLVRNGISENFSTNVPVVVLDKCEDREPWENKRSNFKRRIEGSEDNTSCTSGTSSPATPGSSDSNYVYTIKDRLKEEIKRPEERESSTSRRKLKIKPENMSVDIAKSTESTDESLGSIGSHLRKRTKIDYIAADEDRFNESTDSLLLENPFESIFSSPEALKTACRNNRSSPDTRKLEANTISQDTRKSDAYTNSQDRRKSDANRTSPDTKISDADRTSPDIRRFEANRTSPNTRKTDDKRTTSDIKKSDDKRTSQDTRKSNSNRTSSYTRRSDADRTSPDIRKSDANRTSPDTKISDADRTSPDIRKFEANRTLQNTSKSDANRTSSDIKKSDDNRTSQDTRKSNSNRTSPDTRRSDADRTSPDIRKSDDNRTSPDIRKSDDNRTSPDTRKSDANRTSPNTRKTDDKRTSPDKRTSDYNSPVEILPIIRVLENRIPETTMLGRRLLPERRYLDEYIKYLDEPGRKYLDEYKAYLDKYIPIVTSLERNSSSEHTAAGTSLNDSVEHTTVGILQDRSDSCKHTSDQTTQDRSSSCQCISIGTSAEKNSSCEHTCAGIWLDKYKSCEYKAARTIPDKSNLCEHSLVGSSPNKKGTLPDKSSSCKQIPVATSTYHSSSIESIPAETLPDKSNSYKHIYVQTPIDKNSKCEHVSVGALSDKNNLCKNISVGTWPDKSSAFENISVQTSPSRSNKCEHTSIGVSPENSSCELISIETFPDKNSSGAHTFVGELPDIPLKAIPEGSGKYEHIFVGTLLDKSCSKCDNTSDVALSDIKSAFEHNSAGTSTGRNSLFEHIPASTLPNHGNFDENIFMTAFPGRMPLLDSNCLNKIIPAEEELAENILQVTLPDKRDTEELSLFCETEKKATSVDASSTSDYTKVTTELFISDCKVKSKLVTENVDNFEIACQKRTNGNDTSNSIDVEMQGNEVTGSFGTVEELHENSGETVQSPLDLEDIGTVDTVNGEQIESNCSKLVQTTLDKFFHVIKPVSIFKSVDTHTTKDVSKTVTTNIMSEFMKNKVWEKTVNEKVKDGIEPVAASEPLDSDVKRDKHKGFMGESSEYMVEPDSSVSEHGTCFQNEEMELVLNHKSSVENMDIVGSEAVGLKAEMISILSGNVKNLVEPDSSVGEKDTVLLKKEGAFNTETPVDLESIDVSTTDDAVTSNTEMDQNHDRKQEKQADRRITRGQEDRCKQQVHQEEMGRQVTDNTVQKKQQEVSNALFDSSFHAQKRLDVEDLLDRWQLQGHRDINSVDFQVTLLSTDQALTQSSSLVTTNAATADTTLSEVKSGKEQGKGVVCSKCQHEFKNRRSLGAHNRYCKKRVASKVEIQKAEADQPSCSQTGVAASVTTSENGAGEKSTEVLRQTVNSDFPTGDVVWGSFSRGVWWPALVVSGKMVKKSTKTGFVWLYWLSDRQISQVKVSVVEPFQANFINRCKQKRRPGMQFGIDKALEICASRADVDLREFGSIDAWTKSEQGFLQTKKGKFRPDPEFPVPSYVLKDLQCTLECAQSTGVDKNPNKENRCFRDVENVGDVTASTSYNPSSSDLVHSVQSEEICTNQSVDAIDVDDMDVDEATDDCTEKKDCIACGKEVQVGCNHPLFKGKVCGKCKDTLRESFYAEDDDGCSMFCGVCGEGGNLYVCADNDCGKAFCFTCVEKHISPAAVKQIEEIKHWRCFLCTEYRRPSHGDLVPRENWSLEVVKFFQANSGSMCTDLQYLKNSGRRKLRVLSLFDGIGTGKVALDELGLDVEVYYASEIYPDAMLVSNFHHCPVQLGDIWDLNFTKLKELCPIDLVLGGPPCNDLSIVNPDRKGFNGTGVLVWRFVTVLKDIQTLCMATNHVFWLMENTGSMLNEYKEVISKQFEMEPVVWDAKYFTGQRRARNFWGNIPGMFSTPKFCKQLEKDKKDLDSALITNCNRKARVSHTRTITSSTNSLTITNGVNNALVSMNGEPDHIWVQELERLFGFPIHYTDVGQLTQDRRRKLIGKAWSVPVIKHLLSPLKQYFKVKET